MKYDKRLLQEFLMHLAAELWLQKLGLEGKPAEAKLFQGIQKFRAKYGTSLLPAIDIIDGTAGDQSQQDAAQKARVKKVADRAKHVLTVMEMLGELTFCDLTAPPDETIRKPPRGLLRRIR
jgi:hypothetical protein